MVDEAKLHSPNHSTFEALVVPHVIRHCCGQLGLFLTSAGCRHCSFWCNLLICSAYFSDVMVLLGFRKLEWIAQAADHQTVTTTCFGEQVWLWEVLWSFFSVQPLSWSSPVVVYNPLSIAYHNPIEKWFIVFAQNKRR